MQVLDLAAGYHGAKQIPQGIARRRLSSQEKSTGPDQAARRAAQRAAKARAAATQAQTFQPTNSQSLGDTVSSEGAAEDGASAQEIGYASLGTAAVDTESMAHKVVRDVAAEPLQAQAPPTIAVS